MALARPRLHPKTRNTAVGRGGDHSQPEHPLLPPPMETNSNNEVGVVCAKDEVLRGSCDRCWKKKRHCPGGDPCSRCARGSFSCTYSPRRKIGRPTKRADAVASLQQRQGGSQGKPTEQEGQGPKKPKQDKKQRQNINKIIAARRGGEISAGWNSRCRSLGFRASSSTGLAGMPESHYLSCFLEHCAPMFGFVTEDSVREGLVRVFFDRWDNDDKAVDSSSSLSPTSAYARREAAAIECTLFSTMAVGALMLGAPATAVSRHMKGAGRTLAKFAGWKAQPAVTALILFGLANALLPAPRDGSGHEQQKLHSSSMDDAQAIHEELPANARDPLATSFLTFRATCENLVSVLLTAGDSVDPVNISAWQDGGGGGDCGPRTPRVQAAHPAYVTTDMTTLICSKVGPAGDNRAGWLNVHELLQAGFDRLAREEAGALVLTTVGGHLIAAKGRVGTTEGMLPVAELTLSMFTKCPGLSRYYTVHNAHMALTAFKRCDRRESYNALRSVVVTATGKEIPPFDEFGVGVAGCDLKLCGIASDMILGIPVSPSGCGAGKGAGETTESLPVDDHHQPYQQQQQQQQQRQSQWDADSPSRAAPESGLGLGLTARALGTAAGATPPCSSISASNLGLAGELLGDGIGWPIQLDAEPLHGKPPPAKASEGQTGSGSGIGRLSSGVLSLASHQPDDGRSRHGPPFFSGSDVGSGAGPFLAEADARQQHQQHQQHQLQQHQQHQQQDASEPRQRVVPAAAVDTSCPAPDDRPQQLLRCVDSNDGGGIGYPLQGLPRGQPPLAEHGGGASTSSFSGRRGSGSGVDGDEDEGTSVCSDLVDLLLDNALL